MADAVTGGDGNVAQKEFWSSDFGQKWVTHQQQMDTLFRNVTAELLRRCAVTAGSNVLDIGCGTGETTIAFAKNNRRASSRSSPVRSTSDSWRQ